MKYINTIIITKGSIDSITGYIGVSKGEGLINFIKTNGTNTDINNIPPITIINQAAIFVFVGSETFSSIKLYCSNFYVFDLFILAKFKIVLITVSGFRRSIQFLLSL